MNDTPNILRIYTDGSASPNPGRAAWAYLVVDNNDNIIRKFSKSFLLSTNNRCEVMPLIAVLQWLQVNPIQLRAIHSYNKIIITSDSEYLILGVKGRMTKWKANEWKNTSGRVINLDLWKKLDNLLPWFKNLEFNLVKGHSGNKYNEIVDKMAVETRNREEAIADTEYEQSQHKN